MFEQETIDTTEKLLEYFQCSEDSIPWNADSLYISFKLSPKFKDRYWNYINKEKLNKYQPSNDPPSPTQKSIYKIGFDKFGRKFISISYSGIYDILLPENFDVNSLNKEGINKFINEQPIGALGINLFKQLHADNIIKK